jgi:hypothetical protein
MRSIETDLASITSENIRLKAQLKRANDEIVEWKRFAKVTATQIGGQVHFSGEFPEGDGEAQRFILTDLLAKLGTVHESEILEHPDYQKLLDENARLKEKLRKVTRKCDSMLAIIRERGYRSAPAHRRDPDVLQDFGTHVKGLGLGRIRNSSRRSALGVFDDSDT